MRVEVAILDSPSLIVRAVSVDEQQHLKKKKKKLRPNDSSASLQVVQANGKADVHFLSVSKDDLFSQFVLQACWDLAFALSPKVQHSSGSS